MIKIQLIPKKEVLTRLGKISDATLYRLEYGEKSTGRQPDPDFPKRIAAGGKVFYDESEINAYIQKLKDRAHRPTMRGAAS